MKTDEDVCPRKLSTYLCQSQRGQGKGEDERMHDYGLLGGDEVCFSKRNASDIATTVVRMGWNEDLLR